MNRFAPILALLAVLGLAACNKAPVESMPAAPAASAASGVTN